MKTNAGKRWYAGAKMMWCFSITLLPASAQQVQEWTIHKTADGSHPSALEQQLVWLMNRARANPLAEGNFLAATGDPGTIDAISYFSVDIARMKQEFAAIPARPPAVFDRRLYEASRQHSEYMISLDTQTHDGQAEQVVQSGYDYLSVRLNIFAYAENAVHCHAGLNIDYGGPPSEGGMQAGRGHRLAIMAADQTVPVFSSVGFAVVPENNASTEVGPLVFSGAYAAAQENDTDSFNRFVTGTVWNDANKNAFYDSGEGLANVRVELDRGGWYAVTGAAGGYAIPVTAAGTYRIFFSGGAFPGGWSRDVTVGGVSVAVDAEVSSIPVTPLPFACTLRLNSSGGLTLSWTGGTPPFQVQQSRQLAEGWTNTGNPTQATSMDLPLSATSGFFRVVSSP